MRLSDILKYNDIVIQCHDNPDADALASGFALYTFLKANGNSAFPSLTNLTSTEGPTF